ncbi:MAG: chemotaxis protein CheW, partial [Chloroflexi bacterium]|nr:chemotaxis protein CheW [Chloroflexota bacterium]
PRAVTRLFHTPEAVLGVLNLRGDILPALDLGVLVAEPPSAAGGVDERFLVLRATTGEANKPTSFAVRVQKLDALRDAGSGEIVPLPSGIPERAARVARGIVAADNLRPWQARILLAVALTRTSDPEAIQALFDSH